MSKPVDTYIKNATHKFNWMHGEKHEDKSRCVIGYYNNQTMACPVCAYGVLGCTVGHFYCRECGFESKIKFHKNGAAYY